MTEESDRFCECGCGEVLSGRRSQRFVSPAHRMRARRAARVSDPAEAAVVPPSGNGSRGSVRLGLEAWLAEQVVEPPEVLVAAARALADEVDADRDDSPLWGRYLDAVRQLQEPVAQTVAINDELRRIYESIGLCRADEEWRHAQYMRAVERGDPYPEGWEKVVPIGCVRGRHSWRRPNYSGFVLCQFCETIKEP